MECDVKGTIRGLDTASWTPRCSLNDRGMIPGSKVLVIISLCLITYRLESGLFFVQVDTESQCNNEYPSLYIPAQLITQ